VLARSIAYRLVCVAFDLVFSVTLFAGLTHTIIFEVLLIFIHSNTLLCSACMLIGSVCIMLVLCAVKNIEDCYINLGVDIMLRAPYRIFI
jgi:hypothetical protein